MAISDTQKVDYLWKKIAYGVTKSDTGIAKQGFEEPTPSPLLIRGDKIWQQSGSIPASIATSSSVVTVYSGSTTVECTEDTNASDNRTWKTNLTDWISPEFGADYLVSVYIANSSITGANKATQVTISANKITAAGLNDDQWYFDYQSGVLHFIGTNIPTAIGTGVNGKSIYITGARYVGGIGFGTSSSTTVTTATLGNLYIASNTISSLDTNANINLSPNGTGNVVISANVNAGNVVTANYFSGDGRLLTNISSGAISGAYSNTNTGAYLTSYTGDFSGGNLTLTGNLIIGGTTTRVNSTITTIVDPIIELGANANGATLNSDDNKDRGLLLHYYSGTTATDAFIGWDDSNVEFGFGSNVTATSEVITWNSYGNVRAGYFLGNGSQLTGVSATTATTATSAYKLANGSSNVNIASYDGNITMGVNNTANIVIVTSTGVIVSGNTDLGSNANIKISGGSPGYILKTDGTGNLSWGTDSSVLNSAVDEFTGTGSITEFTLSASPINKNYTFAVVHGIMQPKSSYSVTGNKITFGSAPPDGALVEVTTLGLG